MTMTVSPDDLRNLADAIELGAPLDASGYRLDEEQWDIIRSVVPRLLDEYRAMQSNLAGADQFWIVERSGEKSERPFLMRYEAAARHEAMECGGDWQAIAVRLVLET